MGEWIGCRLAGVMNAGGVPVSLGVLFVASFRRLGPFAAIPVLLIAFRLWVDRHIHQALAKALDHVYWRHAEVWPCMRAILLDQGVRDSQAVNDEAGDECEEITL